VIWPRARELRERRGQPCTQSPTRVQSHAAGAAPDLRAPRVV